MWKQAMCVASLALDAVETLDFRYDKCFGDQVRRAALSVPSNLAEGYGRDTAKDYARFLGIARGSLYELDTVLILAQQRGLLVYLAEFQKQVRAVVKMVNSAQNKLRSQYVRENEALEETYA